MCYKNIKIVHKFAFFKIMEGTKVNSVEFRKRDKLYLVCVARQGWIHRTHMITEAIVE